MKTGILNEIFVFIGQLVFILFDIVSNKTGIQQYSK